MQKPARYIGWRTAPRRRCTPPTRSPGSSPTPTPTRSACPTRASRSSTRSSTSATTPSPSGPTARGPTWPTSSAPPASRSSASTPTARPRDFDVLAFNLSAELVYTNVLECIDLAGVAGARRPRGPTTTRSSSSAGHCAFNPEPLADFVDVVVLGDGEEVVGEITEVRRGVEAWRASRQAAASACCATSPSSRASTSRRSTSAPTTAPPSSPSRPGSPTCPSGSRSAPSPTSPTGPTPSSQLVPLTEVVHDRLNVEVFRGCTRGCRFCQAGMITRPVRERPADQVRTMVSRGPPAHRLRRGGRSRRCRRPTSPASTRSSTTSPAATSCAAPAGSCR